MKYEFTWEERIVQDWTCDGLFYGKCTGSSHLSKIGFSGVGATEQAMVYAREKLLKAGFWPAKWDL